MRNLFLIPNRPVSLKLIRSACWFEKPWRLKLGPPGCSLHGLFCVLAILSIQNSEVRSQDGPLIRPADNVPVQAGRLLKSLVFNGPDLHRTLANRKMDDTVRHLPAGLAMPRNPHISSAPEYVRAIAGAGSQGRMNDHGVAAVLYALYVAEQELGF